MFFPGRIVVVSLSVFVPVRLVFQYGPNRSLKEAESQAKTTQIAARNEPYCNELFINMLHGHAISIA